MIDFLKSAAFVAEMKALMKKYDARLSDTMDDDGYTSYFFEGNGKWSDARLFVCIEELNDD